MSVDATWLFHRHELLNADGYREALRLSQWLALKPLETLVLAGIYPANRAAAVVSSLGCIEWWSSWPLVLASARAHNSVPADVAAEHRAIPIRRDKDGYLLVAMTDPIDEAACEEIAFFAGSGLQRVCVPAPMASMAIHAIYGIETSFLRLWNERHVALSPARRVVACSAAVETASPPHL